MLAATVVCGTRSLRPSASEYSTKHGKIASSEQAQSGIDSRALGDERGVVPSPWRSPTPNKTTRWGGHNDVPDRPWITSDAHGTLVVMLLRRLVYTVLTLFKSVSLRSDENRLMPFRELFEWIKDTLKWAPESATSGLRARIFAVPPALA